MRSIKEQNRRHVKRVKKFTVYQLDDLLDRESYRYRDGSIYERDHIQKMMRVRSTLAKVDVDKEVFDGKRLMCICDICNKLVDYIITYKVKDRRQMEIYVNVMSLLCEEYTEINRINNKNKNKK